MPDAVPATDSVLVGRYRLVRPLARGGMAQVWEGHDEILDRPVAVKVLHAHLAADAVFIERFRREAIAAARLSHRNITATYDTGTDGDASFIVMELVRGRTLAGRLATDGALPPGDAVAIATQVADALDYAHRAGIVHRDVKPANILLCEDGQVKVSDFGIAKSVSLRAGADLTETGSVLGTMKYLSPEQVDGRPQDGRTDVYALGVVLYEMLTGRPPFVGGTDLATAIQHLQTQPPRPRQLRSGIPRGLDAIVMKAMAKSPDQRYRTAGAMRDALAGADPGAGDATVLVTRDAPLPVDPTTSLPAPTAAVARRRRAWIVPLALIAAAAAVAGGMIFIVSGLRNGSHSGSKAGATGSTIQIAGASAFDPAGDGHEHDDEIRNLTDDDTSTMWSTQTYRDSHFGNLKSGVGFALRLAHPAKLGHVVLTSPSSRWSVQIFVAGQPAGDLAGWGRPAASRSGIPPGQTSIDLGGRTGGAVLVWITDLGDAPAVSISEVKLSG